MGQSLNLSKEWRKQKSKTTLTKKIVRYGGYTCDYEAIIFLPRSVIWCLRLKWWKCFKHELISQVLMTRQLVHKVGNFMVNTNRNYAIICMASMLGHHETEKQTALIKCWMVTMNLKLLKNSDVAKLFNSYSKVKSILNFAIGNHSSEYKQKSACNP